MCIYLVLIVSPSVAFMFPDKFHFRHEHIQTFKLESVRHAIASEVSDVMTLQQDRNVYISTTCKSSMIIFLVVSFCPVADLNFKNFYLETSFFDVLCVLFAV